MIRIGRNEDKKRIAELIAKGFPKQFRLLSKDPETITKMIRIRPENFVVLELDGRVEGVLGFSDGKTFPVLTDEKAVDRRFLILSPIAKHFMDEEFLLTQDANEDMYRLSFFTVNEELRGQGYGRRFFEGALDYLGKDEYVFDVVEPGLLSFYKSMGFEIEKKIQIPFGKIYGYETKWLMRSKSSADGAN